MNNALNYLNQIVEVKIDRPAQSKHPKWNYIYPINYGFVPNTVSGDGEELDAYVLGINEPLDKFVGRCIAVIHRTNDDDDKLIVCKDNQNYTDREINAAIHFQEQYFKSEIIRKK